MALFQKGGDPKRAAEVLKGLGKGERRRAHARRAPPRQGRRRRGGALLRGGGRARRGGRPLPHARAVRARRAPATSRPASSRRPPRCSRAPATACAPAENYERCGRFADAAECLANAGEPEREADLLSRAGEKLQGRPRSSWRTGSRRTRSRCSRRSCRSTPISRRPRRCSARSSASAASSRSRSRSSRTRSAARASRATTCDAFYSLATVHEANQEVQRGRRAVREDPRLRLPPRGRERAARGARARR